MAVCAVKWCRNNITNTNGSKKITFHRFPSDPVAAMQWTEILRRARNDVLWEPKQVSHICSAHFYANDIQILKNGCRRVKNGAFPFKNLYTSPQKQKHKQLEESANDSDLGSEPMKKKVKGKLSDDSEAQLIVSSEVPYDITDELYDFGNFVTDQLMCLDVEDARQAQAEIRAVLTMYIYKVMRLKDPSKQLVSDKQDREGHPTETQDPVKSLVNQSQTKVNTAGPTLTHYASLLNTAGPQVPQPMLSFINAPKPPVTKSLPSHVNTAGPRAPQAMFSFVNTSGPPVTKGSSLVNKAGLQASQPMLSFVNASGQSVNKSMSSIVDAARPSMARPVLSLVDNARPSKAGLNARISNKDTRPPAPQPVFAQVKTVGPTLTKGSQVKIVGPPVTQPGLLYGPLGKDFKILNMNPGNSKVAPIKYVILPSTTTPGFNLTPQLGNIVGVPETQLVSGTSIRPTVTRSGSTNDNYVTLSGSEEIVTHGLSQLRSSMISEATIKTEDAFGSSFNNEKVIPSPNAVSSRSLIQFEPDSEIEFEPDIKDET